MPGFFVDGQDYGGLTYQPVFPQPVIADSLFIGLSGQHDNRQNTLINDTTTPKEFGGSYDFWNNTYMFVDDPCCCPELRCCFPSTVTATVNGFPSATRIPSRSMSGENDTWWTFFSYVSINNQPAVRINSISQCAANIELGSPTHPATLDADPTAQYNTICCPSPDNNYQPCGSGLVVPVCGQNNSLPSWLIPFVNYYKDVYFINEVGFCQAEVVDSYEEYGVYETQGLSKIAWPKAMFPPRNCSKAYCCGTTNRFVGEAPNEIYYYPAQSVAYGDYPLESGDSHIFKTFDPLKQIAPGTNTKYTWPEICSDPTLGIMCLRPQRGNITYGRNTGAVLNGNKVNIGLQTYDADHNGTYICHKLVSAFRPELKPYIIRNNQATIFNDEDKAELLFEVEGRRKLLVKPPCKLGADQDSMIWAFEYNKMDPPPTENDFNTTQGVPSGPFFCVDYPCPKGRNITTDGQLDCAHLVCTAPYGYAKPILKIYEVDNFVNGSGAIIKFDTIPMQFDWDGNMHDTDDSYGVSWGVDNFVIEKSGKNYEIGDTFVIDFDNTYERLLILPGSSKQGTDIHVWRGGQHYPFPRTLKTLNAIEQVCTGDITYDLYEKYNQIKIEDGQQNDPLFQRFPFEEDPIRLGSYSEDHMIQTVRVTEVDENGSITKLEKVPWFKENELRPQEGTEIECPNVDESTPFFPEYSRALCHPQPVAKPGKGYAVGDKIVWVPDITQAQNIKAWKDQYAVGWVIDVDENGGILDWYISGGMFNLNETDAQRVYGVFGIPGVEQQGYYYNSVSYYPSPCYGSLDQYFQTGTYGDEYDDRGYYYYHGTPLCSLEWRGEGVPIRRRSHAERYESAPGYPGSVSPCGSDSNVDENSSVISAINIRIIKVIAETTAGINVELYKYLYSSYAILINGNLGHPDVINIGSQLADLVTNFAPIPKCNGGGAKLKTIIYNCDDPTNPNCGNESVFGGSLSGVQILSSGAYYSFVDRIHEEPILSQFLPKPESGESAVLSYTFDKVSNFPHPDVLNNTFYLKYFGYNYRVDPDRFAYFPIQDITIESPGSGYTIGDEFQIFPEGGGRFAGAWKGDSADNPITYPNGGWYDSNLTNVEPNTGYYNLYNQFPYDILESKAKIRITDVDNNGGIIDIEILQSGMMFRSVETTGVAHPDVRPYINSTLGYGAKSNMVIDSDKDSESFGKLINFYFSNPDFQLVDDGFGNLTPSGIYDPMHSDINAFPPVYTAWDGNDTKGYGRDYANPEHGYFWMLDNIIVEDGSPGQEQIFLAAYYPFGDVFVGQSQRLFSHINETGPDPLSTAPPPYNYIHPDLSTHLLVEGTMPNYVPKSSICCFEECYYPLLNKKYDLVRVWLNSNDIAAIGNLDEEDNPNINSYPYGTQRDGTMSGRPSHPFAVLQKKDTVIFDDDATPEKPLAVGLDYIVVEHGFTITLNANKPLPKDCPNHTDGRTFDGVNLGLNYG